MRKVFTQDDYRLIDELVIKAKAGDSDAFSELYDTFKPAFNNSIMTWSKSFNDPCFHKIRMDDLKSDIMSWFYQYTINFDFAKGVYFAVYIKRVMNLRIRYIYQVGIKEYDKMHSEMPEDFEPAYEVFEPAYEEMSTHERLTIELAEFFKNKPNVKKLKNNKKLIELIEEAGLSVETLEEALTDKKKLRNLKRILNGRQEKK